MNITKRRPMIAGNWKMNKTVPEAIAFARELRGQLAVIRDKVEGLVAPPFVDLQPVAKVLEDSNIGLAAQNCYWAESGAFTGEVSAPMVKSAGCGYVILCPCERPQLFCATRE